MNGGTKDFNYPQTLIRKFPKANHIAMKPTDYHEISIPI